MGNEIRIEYSFTVDHYVEPWDDSKTIVVRSKDPSEVSSLYNQYKKKYEGTNAKITIQKEVSTTVKEEITPGQLERIAKVSSHSI